MERVRAALKRAGIADRDIQTSSINLNPDYRYENNKPPVLTGYQASNNVGPFPRYPQSGAILDALVAEGANQINGPSLTIDKPEQAMDEARVKAIAVGQARAELYARALGKRVVRLLSVSESGGYAVPPPMPMMRAEMADSGRQDIDRARRTANPGQPRDELRTSVGPVKKRAAQRVLRGPS